MGQGELFDAPAPEPTLQERFEAWLALNGHVFEAFLAAARDLKARGRKRFGAKAIYEHLRWNLSLATEGDEFKLNNNWTSRLARRLLQCHPEEFQGFLELRRLQTE